MYSFCKTLNKVSLAKTHFHCATLVMHIGNHRWHKLNTITAQLSLLTQNDAKVFTPVGNDAIKPIYTSSECTGSTRKLKFSTKMDGNRLGDRRMMRLI